MLGSPGSPGLAALLDVPDKRACAVIARSGGVDGAEEAGPQRPQMP